MEQVSVEHVTDEESCGSLPSLNNSSATVGQNLTVVGQGGRLHVTHSGVSLVVGSGFNKPRSLHSINTVAARKLKRQKTRKSGKKSIKKRENLKKSEYQRLPIADEEHPWVVRIMSMEGVVCTGTVVHQHFVLTTAACMHNSTSVYILLHNHQPVSLSKVYSQHQYALLETRTALLPRAVCLARRGGSKIWYSLIYIMFAL